MYCCCGKAEFAASLLQSSVSHDPSEIILQSNMLLKKHFLLLSMSKTVANIFVETVMHFFKRFFD